MTLKQLEYFMEIAKMGSITKAAANLNVSQPPLSLQLRLLEEELGVPLFTRNNKKVEITSAGKILEERVSAVFGLLNETVSDIRATSDNKKMTLRIGTIGSVNSRLLPKKILDFSRDYPYVNFSVVEGNSDSILQDLSSGNVDFCFVRQPFNNDSFRSIPVEDDVLAPNEQDCFATIALPQFYDFYFEGGALASIAIEELQGKPLVIHRRYREILIKTCKKAGFTPNIICENGEIQSSLSWARAGIGIAIAPYTSALMNTDPALIIRKLDAITLSPQVCLVWNPSLLLSREAKAFIHYV